MRLALLLALVALAGCTGGPDRGGWTIFMGGESCRDCEQLVHAQGDGEFEMARTFDVPAGYRIFGWYESPIEEGTHLVLEWVAPALPKVETRQANEARDGWTTQERACVADAAPAQPTPTSPTITTPGSQPLRRCVLDMTTTVRLEAPRNGISMIWETEVGHLPAQVTFSARYGP